MPKRVDDEIDSDEYDSDVQVRRAASDDDDDAEPPAEAEESRTLKRRRLAKEYLQSIEQEAKQKMAQTEAAVPDEHDVDTSGLAQYNFDAKDLDDELIARRLQQDATESRGYIYKRYGSTLKASKKCGRLFKTGGFLVNPSGVAVAMPHAYVVSKSGILVKYDVSDPQRLQRVKYVRTWDSYTAGGSSSSSSGGSDDDVRGHSGFVTCVACSDDGRFVVTGSSDRSICVWDAVSLQFLKKMTTNHRHGCVNAVAFRRGTCELYVASDDLKIRIFNVAQFSLIDTLFGHQDKICDVSALAAERCVTVGSRDRSAMLWKIPEQTRMAYNGTTSFEKFWNTYAKKNGLPKNSAQRQVLKESGFFSEGSLECVAMIDNAHFVTASDNGNVSLWSTSKKKPVYTVFQAHGLVAQKPASEYSGDLDYAEAAELDPKLNAPRKPFWVTAVAALPYSDLFATGSHSGELLLWRISEDAKSFQLLYKFQVKGVITGIDFADDKEHVKIVASVGKEHRLGRWIKGSVNGVFCVTIPV